MNNKAIGAIAGSAGFVLGAASMFAFLYFNKGKIIEAEADKRYNEHVDELIAAYKRRDEVLEKHEKPDISAVAESSKATAFEEEVAKTIEEAQEMIETQNYISVETKSVFDDSPIVLTPEMTYDPDDYVTLYYVLSYDGYLLDDNYAQDDDAAADITIDILDQFKANEETGEIEVLRGGRRYVVTKSLGTYKEITGKDYPEE